MKMPPFKILHIAQVMLKAYDKSEEELVKIGPRETDYTIGLANKICIPLAKKFA